ECAMFIEAVTAEKDADGLRTLPLTSSPEIHDNKPDAWFPTITNYDLALVRWLLDTSAVTADAVDRPEDALRWRRVLSEMPPLSLGEDGRLLVAKGLPLEDSH